ncbi:hypothetical protein [Evansella tamaricis]|uniref:Uncharacterized protein n=1 Tax=Evansella tamaricis TaxID=2069301 RepID=A0ABS6JLJ5_9BACI|nr:hypothetical protein [Evansella tamaricis]MBU9714446.1 hypothetical protein [Evansella tamaricis]
MKQLIKVSPISEDLVRDPDLYIYQYRADNNSLLWDKIVTNYYDAYGLEDYIMFERENEPLYMMEQFNIEDDEEVYVFKHAEPMLDQYEYDIAAYRVKNDLSEVEAIDYVLTCQAEKRIKESCHDMFFRETLQELIFKEDEEILKTEIMKQRVNETFDKKEHQEMCMDYLSDKNVSLTDEFKIAVEKRTIKRQLGKGHFIEKVDYHEDKVML